MQIILNGTFWNQPTVGSGQYIHGLLRWLPRLAPQHRYVLVVPAAAHAGPPPPPGVTLLPLGTPFDGRNANLAKLWFEQVSLPHSVHLVQRAWPKCALTLLHCPYFAPPLHTIVPSIVTIPDLIPLLLPAYQGGPHVQLYLALVRRSAVRADHGITFSQYSQHDITRLLQIAPQRLTTTLLAADERYIPSANLDNAQAHLAARYGLRGPFLYYVGGLDVRKNVAVLIEAAARLRQQGRLSAPLVIAGRALGGDARLFPDLDALIARLDMGAHVRRISVPHEDGPLLYQTCTAFVFPSRYEGFGLPPLEAMACGAPVAVSTASSLPEVVGEAALQVDPDDVGGWAEAFDRLLHDAPLRADLRRRGLAQAASFSWQRVAAETLAVYERVAAEAQRRRLT